MILDLFSDSGEGWPLEPLTYKTFEKTNTGLGFSSEISMDSLELQMQKQTPSIIFPLRMLLIV